MVENPFGKYRALVFDCYGTLIDWETGIYDSLRPLFERTNKPTDRGTVIDDFSTVERDLQARFPSMRYSDLLAKVYATLDARLQDNPTPAGALRDDTPSSAAEAFAQSVAAWQPFPDTIPALVALSKRYKLIILSNIDRETIAKTRAVLEGPPERRAFAFDGVYTAEEVGAYKPAPEMLSFALARLEENYGIKPEEVLMTAQSVFHDIIPAKGRGLDTAWINRAGAVTGLGDVLEGEDTAKYVFTTLGELANAVEGVSA
ncbi:haloalkanoic acid dehalogenase [Lenzites betulinus]|nr:haloalkanoic acid dehalogenase [Lenzites betulinus]